MATSSSGGCLPAAMSSRSDGPASSPGSSFVVGTGSPGSTRARRCWRWAARLAGRVELVEAPATPIPFADASSTTSRSRIPAVRGPPRRDAWGARSRRAPRRHRRLARDGCSGGPARPLGISMQEPACGSPAGDRQRMARSRRLSPLDQGFLESFSPRGPARLVGGGRAARARAEAADLRQRRRDLGEKAMTFGDEPGPRRCTSG